MALKLPLLPSRGFKNSVPRQHVELDQFSDGSRDWLVVRGRLRRRPGSAIYGDTLTSGHETNGILEGSWSAKCKRLASAFLKSLTDNYPTVLGLWANESTKRGQVAWYSTNDSSWQTLGSEFGSTHYPASTAPNFRAIPQVVENEHGGLTLHRFKSVDDREYAAGGSRDVVQFAGQVATPGYTSAPSRWDGGFNDSSGSGSEVLNFAPIGLIPPLQMPGISAGNSLGASVTGPWKGSDAFFFSLIFENDKGEWSMFTIPRPPNSSWNGYEGYGYFQVDSANPTYFYDSLNLYNIADGPPGTVKKHLCRTQKVSVSDGQQPAIDTLGIFATIPQGTTSYVTADGNDLSLDQDPRIIEMFRGGGLQWPPRARYIGRFDGHVTLGCLRPNPYALIAAPWVDGTLNLQIDDDGLYNGDVYAIAISPTAAVLRKVHAGSATDTTYDLANITLRDLCDRVNADASYTTLNFINCHFVSGALVVVNDSGVFTGVAIGDEVVSASFPAGTKVVRFIGSGVTATVLVDHPATATLSGQTVTFRRRSGAATRTWGMQVVPGADADEAADSLLRTYVPTSGTWSNGTRVITVTAGDDLYISPGMAVQHANFPSTTRVVSVDTAAHTVTTDTNATGLGSGATIYFGYDTGDTATALRVGFVRAFGNAFPAVLPWSKDYLDRFAPDLQGTTFSAASPGYPQDGLNTWLARNRRSAPQAFGALMGFADLGAREIHFYARARMLLWNPRTGTTHNDEDYIKTTESWARGCRSPYAIASGNGWAAFLSDDGIFVTDGGSGETCISGDIYDPSQIAGQRGELEYAIGECIKSSESDGDSYKLSMQVHGSILYVRYHSSASATYPDREIRYDFSAGVEKTGLAEVLQPNGAPYPWSTPLTLRVSCSARVANASGVHTYGAIDSNAGTTSGRVDEIDTGTQDNGTDIRPVGYTGLYLPDDLMEIQPEMVYAVSSKKTTGIEIWASDTPERASDEAEWNAVGLNGAGPDEYGRFVKWFKPNQRLRRSALQFKITDDGSGTWGDLSTVQVKADQVMSTTGNRRQQGVP